MNNDTIGRFGYVTEYDAERHFARVEFPDYGLVSGWLPVGVHNTKDNHDEHGLDVGEHVYCLLHDNTGVIICAVYDDKNKPPVHDENVRVVTFKDGTTISYDRDKHATDVKDCNGNVIHMGADGIVITSCKDISITAAGNITETAARIDLNP